MDPIATQQANLDNALVPSEKRLKVERCNARIAFSKPQKEETYQVTLEALKLSPCYLAFQITAEVPAIYIHQFVELPFEDDLLSFIKELGYSGNCEMLSTIRTDQMHQPWRTFGAVINKCISGKTTGVDRLGESGAQILWAMYNQMNVYYVALIWENFMCQADNKEISSARKEHMPYPRFTKVIINHFISKENTISIRNRINLYTIRDDTLLGTLKFISKTEYYQKKVPHKKARKFKKHSSPKLKTIPVSAKEPTQKGDSKDESDGVYDEDDNDDDDGNDDDSGNDDDGGNDAHDSERTNSDDDENPSFTLKDYEEEEQDEEYMHTLEKDKFDDEENMCEEEDDDVTKELYGDLNITQELRDTDVTNAEQCGPLQSSSISSDFTCKLLNLYDPSPNINSLMDTSTVPPPPPPFDQRVSALETKVSEFNQTSQFVEAVFSLLSIVNNYLASTLKEEVNAAVQLQSNKLKEEVEGENQEFFDQVDSTRKAIIKEQVKAQVSKIMPQIKKYVTESQGAKVLVRSTNQPQTSYTLAALLFEFELKKILNDKMETNESINRSDVQRHGFNLLKGTCKSFVKLEYHFEECYKAVNDKLNWNNPEGHAYPFDLSKPLSSIKDRGCQVVPANYFINNDLEYLKGGSSSSKYVTSTTRTKAGKYDNIEGIKDMVPTLWSLVKVAYNKHDVRGTYHWEIVVRRDDNVLYKFKESDFLRLNLYDIEDTLLLLVQKKLSNLDIDDRYDLGVALRIFTRRIVILYCVKDLQLGVESYQKKFNITNELYKFYDRTLSSVRTVLHDIASSLEIDYLPKRHWSNLEKKRSRIMIKAIDKLLFKRRLMRNLEKFIGGRE
nr:hypothetical protein [Tanacetum cinerariifolium]